jgi:hypothetical protein
MADDLFHQFDILCGWIGVTYRGRRSSGRSHPLCRIGQRSGCSIAGGVEHGAQNGEQRIVAMNPLAGARRRRRRPKASFAAGAFASIVDDAGRKSPVQYAGDSVLFLARGVPG